MKDDSPINIIEDIWHYLSPFSAHQIDIWGERFYTAEHAYQCAKFVKSKEREEVKNANSPLGAWRTAQKYKSVETLCIKDFDKDKVMEQIFRAKIEQHTDILEILKLSEGRGFLKIHALDFYWGTGADGSGQNKMGKMWMKLREDLLG